MALVVEPNRNREITIELAGQEATFILAPESYDKLAAAFEWAERQGLWDPEKPGVMGNMAGFNKQLMNRIVGWKGFILASGEDLPCTEENKLVVFGKFPGALLTLSVKLQEQVTADQKNSETLPGGTPAS